MQNSPARQSIDVGSVIADTYTIEALIGRGGMGAVFLASHKRLPGKKVAIKLLHSELSSDEVLARFKREAEIASRLGHPNIVQVHDFNVLPDGTPYLVLEFLHGETLAQRLTHGPLPLDQAMSIVRQVGSALAAAHREGIVHRDLKPQNIFLVPTEVAGNTVEVAKVLDFGISKIRGSQTVKTQDSALLGTPQYMAPEQATGQHANVDERTDVFALGAIVYEMLAGHPAFSGASIPEVVFKVVYEQPAPIEQTVADLSPQIRSTIQTAMQKKSEDRFPTVAAFVESLTGKPLVLRAVSNSLPPADTNTPSTGSKVRSTGNEAFAQTMGSGDHGASPISGMAATQSASGAQVSPQAATVDSQRGVLAASPITTQPPIATTAGGTPTTKRSIALALGLAIGGAAIAAVIMYVVMRGDKPAAKPDPVAVAPSDAAVAKSDPVVTEAPPVTPSMEAVATQPEPPAPAKIEPKKPPTPPKLEPKKPPTPPTPPKESDASDEPEAASDPTTNQKLLDAEAAYAAGQLERAELLANQVVNGDSANTRQKMRARSVRGAVRCLLHNDEEGAHANLRPIPRAMHKLRQRIIAACHKQDMMREER